MEIGMLIDNLISNSQKARASFLTIDMHMDKHDLVIGFVDNGRGVEKMEAPERIFEKGFTRTNGSGIGLYFCKQVLGKLDSTISLTEPQPKTGASFTIRIMKK